MTEQEIRARLSGTDLSIFEQAVLRLIDNQAAEIAELRALAQPVCECKLDAQCDGFANCRRLGRAAVQVDPWADIKERCPRGHRWEHAHFCKDCICAQPDSAPLAAGPAVAKE
jgi:hypothetical protein